METWATHKETSLAFAKMVMLVNGLKNLEEDTSSVHVKTALSFMVQDAKEILATMEKDGWNPHSV